ncbi:uncharacterized protein LOC131356489 [Hemibagrus wyckioides]|uniref:uncharacterized protein LOC131356489 n=1 Tax=Hemibagrus wyckioides TaxID=337641 RepID=UPI00266C250A|nr:uncharacterized protein LOC131356489 [Hemibagrus wyckioides]
MLAKRSKVTLEDYIRRKNKNKVSQYPTNNFSIIPSWNKEFVCLVGLENVVQFRLEWLDKTAYSSSNQHKTSGNLRTYPYTCAKCNTDVSCTWKRDVDSSILCDSCFRCCWKKDHWVFREPPETIIRSVSGSSSIFASSSQPGWNEPEAVFPLQHSSYSIQQQCDQQVAKNSKLHPDSPCYCSSCLYSDLSSSPSESFSDTSFQWSSSCSSSLCDGSSPSYLSFSSDLNSSSSSSMTSPSSGFPLVNPNQCISQKVTKSYRMETPLAKALIKDDKVEQEMKKEIEEWKMMNKSQSKEEKNGKMAALNAPSRQQILPKTQLLTPNVQRKSAKKYKMTIKELNTVHGNLQKVTPNVSSATSGSSTNTSGSGKSKPTIHYLPKTWSAVSGNARNQGSRSSAKKGPVTMDEKFSVEVQHQANLTHPSTAQISSASTHMFSSSQTALSTNQGKTNPWDNKWEATSNQKIDDKWIQKPKNSVKCTGSYASSSSSLFGQPTK